MPPATNDCKVVVIGAVAFIDNDGARSTRRQVLRMVALLVAAQESGVEAVLLAEEMWDDDPPRNWNSALRNAATEIRGLLGSTDTVRIRNGRYVLDLDPSHVDAWSFLDTTNDPAVSPQVLETLTRFRPFEGLEPTRLIRRMTVELNERRITILNQFDPNVIELSPSLLTELAEQVLADPFDTALAETITRLLLRFAKLRDAQQLLQALDAKLQIELDTGLPPRLALLLEEATKGATATPAPETKPKAREPLPAYFARQLEEPMTSGSLAHVNSIEIPFDAATNQRILILTGPAGIGKSRYAAQLASSLHHRGAHVAVGAGVDGATAKYEPLLAAFPKFRDWHTSTNTTDEASAWSAFSCVLDSTEDERPLCLIIDDAHHLDVSTFRMLELAHRSPHERPVRIIVVGRDNGGTTDWIDFQTRCLSVNHESVIEVPPLTLNDTTELIGRRHPNSAGHTRLHAAHEIRDVSGGLPLVTRLLIESLSGNSLHLNRDDESTASKLLVNRIRMLDENQQRAASAASILGPLFTNTQLAAVLAWTTDHCDDVLDLLVFAEVIHDSQIPNQYSFAHDMYREAAGSVTPRRLRRQWHHHLLTQDSDPIQRARHALGAVPLIEPEIAAKYALAASRSAFEAGLSRQCLEMLTEAETHLGSLDLDSEVLRARALGRTVAVEASAASRRKAIDLARIARNGDPAFDATSECLTHAEPLDRYDGFLDELNSYADIPLSKAKRFECWLAIARTAALVGRPSEGIQANHQAELVADTAMQRTAVTLSDWFVRSTHDPKDNWIASLDQHLNHQHLNHQIDTPQQRLLHQAVAIEHARNGNFEQASDRNQSFLNVDDGTGEPLRQWHGLLFVATMHGVHGNWELQAEAADAAASKGFIHDIPGAASARTAQAFAAALGQGRIGPWLDSFSEAAPDITSSVLAEAAIARSLFEIDLIDDASDLALKLVDKILTSPNLDAVPIIAAIAPVLAHSGSTEVLEQTLTFLAPHAGRWAVIGAGVAVLGPLDQVVAVLRHDVEDLRRIRTAIPEFGPWAALLERDIERTTQR